jgi:fermentation-respiration switch protein FrsA (DUF1100 family)
VRLFLDSSVLLAAAGSASGASRAIFSDAEKRGWPLIGSPYAVDEVLRNLEKLPTNATSEWLRLRSQLQVVDDVVSLDRPVVFGASKDRPILFTALAWATVLLTLDKADFADMLGGQFYGMDVLLPYDFLERDRTLQRAIRSTRAGLDSER